MIFDTEKFNKEISALKNLREHEELHPLKKEQLKQAVLQTIAGETKNSAQRFTWQERRSAFMRYLIATMLGIFMVGGTVFASGNAKPGDVLFPVKKATEAVRLQLVTSEHAKAELQSKFAEERLKELTEIKTEAPTAATSSPESAKKTEAQVRAETEVNNAITTLQQVKVSLEAKGNTEAAEAVGKTIVKLQAKEKSENRQNKEEKEAKNATTASSSLRENLETPNLGSHSGNQNKKSETNSESRESNKGKNGPGKIKLEAGNESSVEIH